VGSVFKVGKKEIDMGLCTMSLITALAR